ncbi:MAG: hypothetical protein K2O01_02905 [Bacteroidales bacterium]|nr:hypothetical protein [Bacteroidales bacterium]
MPMPHARKSKRLLGGLLLLTVGLGLFCACQSARHLCPAYDQHYRRETLPY